MPPSGGVPGAQLQQIRWPPTLIADTPAQALSRLFILDGAHYSEPEFSWKFEVAPGGIGFVRDRALGPRSKQPVRRGGDVSLGRWLPVSLQADLESTENRCGRSTVDDRVADNLAKHEITESESLLVGRDFGDAWCFFVSLRLRGICPASVNHEDPKTREASTSPGQMWG
jgi:aldose sugar dehydrogenase